MKIILATKQKHFVDAFRIRARVFVGEQKVQVDLEIDKFDENALIFVAYQKETAVGTGRIIIKDHAAKIGRVAVVKEQRCSGIGSQLILKMMKDLKDHKQVKEIHIGAQINTMKFYEKLGYKAYGHSFNEAGIKHIMMKYQLNTIA